MFQEKIKSLYARKGGVAWDIAWTLGFPDRKVESYRKVPLQVVSKFPVAHVGIPLLESRVPKPISLLTLAEARKTYSLFLENRAKARLKGAHFFAALTEAVFEEGFFLYVPPNTIIDEVIPLSFAYSGEGGHFAPHLQIFVGRGAKVRFQTVPKFDRFQSGVTTQVVDIYMDKNSSCDWIETTHLPYQAIYVNSVKATLKEDSRLQLWSATKGSQFFRQDFRVDLAQGSDASLKGASDLEGDRVSHTEILMEHKGPHARSNQHFKAVLRDQSRATFEGKIFVEPEAQKTEAYQLNNNLLLGSEATVFSKPNLEIFADDVKATHGATVTQLSEEELFYFRTRGIGKGEAGHFLASGFLKDVLYSGV